MQGAPGPVERVAGVAAVAEGVLLHALPGRRTTWNGSITGTASGSSSAAAVLNPVNPSIATTSTPSRHACGLSASHCLNACLDRPSTMSSSRAGPVPSRLGVRSMITVTYGGGRRMYLECSGSGSPTVVLITGLREVIQLHERQAQVNLPRFFEWRRTLKIGRPSALPLTKSSKDAGCLNISIPRKRFSASSSVPL